MEQALLASDGKRRRVEGGGGVAAGAPHVVSPGDVITEDTGFMRGHGTYLLEGKLLASVAGVVEKVNKLISVRPLRTRYVGEIGDVVVGRITEVGQRRWKVDCQTRLDAVLQLSSVNLPGGVLRRRSAADELMMREFFVEGDVISCEVQTLFQDGALSLHTRSLKYGKLERGSFVEVSPVLVKRCKNHFHLLPCGVGIVLGNNGYIWVGDGENMEATRPDHDSGAGGSGADADAGPIDAKVPMDMRVRIARVRNVILALAQEKLSIFDTSIVYSYDDSEPYEVKDLARKDIAREITLRAREACALSTGF
eukprot:gene9618-17642_t